MLRARGRTVQTNDWAWIGEQTGQRLFEPPNVAGWDYTRWLDTSRWSGRFLAVNYALMGIDHRPRATSTYPADESPSAAVQRALKCWGDPVCPRAR